MQYFILRENYKLQVSENKLMEKLIGYIIRESVDNLIYKA